MLAYRVFPEHAFTHRFANRFLGITGICYDCHPVNFHSGFDDLDTAVVKVGYGDTFKVSTAHLREKIDLFL